MRNNQISITIERFGDEAKNGRKSQKLRIYCDSNNVWEALTGAYHEATSEVLKTDPLPRFGVRASYPERLIDSIDEIDKKNPLS